MKDQKTTIQELKNEIRKFVEERNWQKFQNMRSLAISLSLESNELLDHFQWLNDKEVHNFEVNKENVKQLGEELIDILSYILIAADKLDIDVAETFFEKLTKNRKKYKSEDFNNLKWEEDNKLYQQKRREWDENNEVKSEDGD